MGPHPLKTVLAGGLGFEPRSTESESAVLPLNDPPAAVETDYDLLTIGYVVVKYFQGRPNRSCEASSQVICISNDPKG